MTPSTCDCGRPTRDHAYTCDTCLDQTAIHLGDCTWLDNELHTSITKQRGIDPTTATVRGTETPLMFNAAASKARDQLHAALTELVRFCREEHIASTDPHNTNPTSIVGMSRWLLWRVDGMAYNDLTPVLTAKLAAAVTQSRHAIDRPADRWFAGPCNALVADGAECGADMYAKTTSGTVTCPTCNATHDVPARRAWLLQAAEDQLADAATLARSVSWLGSAPLTAARVRKWAERGRIAVKGHTSDGRPMYRIGDAIDLLAADAA